MIEALVELIAEFVLELALELLVEMGLHAMAEPMRQAPHPAVAALGYALFGGLIGGISLLIVPQLMIASPLGRLVNLLLTPTAAGLCMSALGAWRTRRGQARLRIDRFAYGFLFALALGLVRFLGAH